MSKIATVLGLLLALVVLFLGIFDFHAGRMITAFFNWQGLLVVIGGSLAALLINYPLSHLRCLGAGIKKVFTAEPHDILETIEQIDHLSHIAHSRTLLALEKELGNIADPFMRFAVSEALIFRDLDTLRVSLKNEIFSMQRRHQVCHDVFNNLASYAPAFGMMGTVMGLIMMMTQQAGGEQVIYGTEASKDMLGSLLQGMGLALVTTFYGVVFSNLIFQPIAGKLKGLTEAEVLKNQVILEGILQIRNNQPPMLVKEALMSFVDQTQKEEMA